MLMKLTKGLNSLPKDVAFFSGVDVDRVSKKSQEPALIIGLFIH